MARSVTLIVEDGTVVAGANSFVNEEAIVNYARSRGVTLLSSNDEQLPPGDDEQLPPGDDEQLPPDNDEQLDAVAVLGIKAMDYMRTLPWRGQGISPTQTTPWPRKDLGVTPSIPEDAIPLAVIEAQLQLTLLVHGGTELIPVHSGTGYLLRERIGPIDNIYSEKTGVSSDGMPLLPTIRLLLGDLLLSDMAGTVPVRIQSLGDRSWRE
jgi:hypothetical protein